MAEPSATPRNASQYTVIDSKISRGRTRRDEASAAGLSTRRGRVKNSGRWRSGQSQQTVNLPALCLRRFEPSPPHQSFPGAPSRRERLARWPEGKIGGEVNLPTAFIWRQGALRAPPHDGGESELTQLIGSFKSEGARAEDGRDIGGSNSVVESQPSKLLVAGSIPVSRSTTHSALSAHSATSVRR